MAVDTTAKAGLHKDYQHWVPDAPLNEDWDKELTFVLIRSLDELRVHDVEHRMVAWDTETSGFNPDTDWIVGFSFSFDGKTGYYVPVKHDDIALGKEALDIFHSILKKAAIQFLYNCRFDQRFMEAAGYSLDGLPYYDAMNAIWLADTNVVMPSLKSVERKYLGWTPKTFSETLGEATTFQHVPAEDAYAYSCVDAIGTFQIALCSNRYYKESLPASRYDNEALYPLMRLENTPQRLDLAYLKSMRETVVSTIERTRAKVYELAGREFNLNSSQQFGKVLVEVFGVDTGIRTSTGAMKADLKTVDAWLVKMGGRASREVRDFLAAYKEFKKTVKFQSSYLEKYIKAAEESDVFPIRFSYKMQSVPTGRVSCGGDLKNKFFTANNVQCLEENTEVLTSEGIKPIKDIVTGELVWSGSAFVPCVQLGSKQKRCETIWTYFGKITASLEHKFYTLNLFTFELEWECLGNAISCGKPLVRNTNDGGFTFRELLENEMFKKSMLLKPELSEERIKELEEIYEDVRFDMVRKADNFWYPNIIPPEVTVYDLCVPTYERFTANGFIVHNSTPKPHAIMLKGRRATEAEMNEGLDILGWYFSNDIPDGEEEGYVEGMDQDNLNIRRAFLPENDQCYVVSIDMCAEELRVVANIYGEKTWCDAFNNGVDVHRATAIRLFGEENYSKDARKKAKCLSGRTKVLTEHGAVFIRDLVPASNGYLTGVPVPLKRPVRISTPEGMSDVTHWIYNGVQDTLRICIESTLILEVTPDHLVGMYDDTVPSADLCSKYRLVRADSLKVGDKLLWDYAPMRVTSIEHGRTDVYDITVNNASHTFYADGIVVHNCASFGILYGSGAQGFNQNFPDMTLDECRDFLKKFKEALPRISEGQNESVAYARIHGTINTGYGRQRRVRFWLESSDRAKVAFGERTVKNSIVQGTAADVLKIILCRLWKHVFKPYPQVKFMSTIHDEVNFSIPIELAREVIPICMKCMTIERDDWPVTLKCSLSISRTDLGSLVPFTYDRDTDTYTPDWEAADTKAKHKTEPKPDEAEQNESADDTDDDLYGMDEELCML